MKTLLAALCVLLPIVSALPWHWSYANDQQTPAQRLPIATSDSACKSVAVSYEGDALEYIHVCSFPGRADSCVVTEMDHCCGNSSYEALLSTAVELNSFTYNTLIYRTASGQCYTLVPDVVMCIAVAKAVASCLQPVHPCDDCYSPGSNGTCSYEGQCSCLHGYTGRTCSACDDHYYFSDDGKCNLCAECCDVGVAESCSNSTGQCVCKAGYVGQDCCTCGDGYFDNGNGCEKNKVECSCCEENSVSGDCEGSQCVCKTGSVGADCCQCDEGYSKTADGLCAEELKEVSKPLDPQVEESDGMHEIDKAALESEIMAAVESVLSLHASQQQR